MKTTIGRKDKADFPELALTNIDVKVDTGAYTSSIHCHEIEEFATGDDSHIEFYLLDPSYAKYKPEKFKVKHYEKKNIKSSFGTTEERFVISTTIVIFGQEYPIEMSLSERSNMKYPILLGRRFLNEKFVVDTTESDLSFKMKKSTSGNQ